MARLVIKTGLPKGNKKQHNKVSRLNIHNVGDDVNVKKKVIDRDT